MISYDILHSRYTYKGQKWKLRFQGSGVHTPVLHKLDVCISFMERKNGKVEDRLKKKINAGTKSHIETEIVARSWDLRFT